MEKMTGPLSTGSLKLASTDVRVNPVDVEKCMNGTCKIRVGIGMCCRAGQWRTSCSVNGREHIEIIKVKNSPKVIH